MKSLPLVVVDEIGWPISTWHEIKSIRRTIGHSYASKRATIHVDPKADSVRSHTRKN